MSQFSRFFAYLNRLSLIRRWGLMRNTREENVMEHSWQVATIAHTLAVIARDIYQQQIDPEQVATTALYHDCSEIITGDMPAPVKYHSQTITQAYKAIEQEAEQNLLALLPDKLQNTYRPYLLHHETPTDVAKIVKSADLISAYLKCHYELDAGNREFKDAANELERKLRELEQPEVDYFMATFVESYQLTLDELLAQHNPKK